MTSARILVNRFLIILLTAAIVAITAVPQAAAAGSPHGVSPGATDRVAVVEGRCPTFIWEAVPGAAFFELVAYWLPDGLTPEALNDEVLAEAGEALHTRVPGGATSWTPELAIGLVPGATYVWFVRVLFERDDGELEDGSWSPGRFFTVSNPPLAGDATEVTEVLRRFLAAGGSLDDLIGDGEAPRTRRSTDPRRPAGVVHSGLAESPKSVSTASTAIRGTQSDTTGETYGVVGLSNSANGAGLAAGNTNGGADLVLDGLLDGQPDAVFTQAGIDRASTGELWFSLINSGAGVLSLNVEGQIVGSGSGLTGVDAETLDGTNGSDFATDAEASGLVTTHAVSADHDGRYFTETELGVSGSAAVHWNNLTSVPAGLDDGDNDTLAGLACAADEIARWTGSAWNCTADGDPLSVANNTIFVAINGSSTGFGTLEKPFDTAQNGYDAAAAAYPGVSSTVVLMGGGSYGPLNMHAGTVSVFGQARSELGDLTVSFGIPSPTLAGKQRVENVIVTGSASVVANGTGAWVKFHNCRFLNGLTIDESYVEVQDCAIQLANQGVPAVSVGAAGTTITEIGIYQSSVLANDFQTAAGTVPGVLTVFPGVKDFEVIGCQITNEGAALGGTAPAVRDLSPPIAPPNPLHLYSYNVFKGPSTGTGNPAVADSMIGLLQPAAPTMAFTHNTVYGDVGGPGGMALPAGTPQFFANNTVYGFINFAGVGAPVGWVQAGAGPGLDGAGNTEHPTGWGPAGITLPSHWDD